MLLALFLLLLTPFAGPAYSQSAPSMSDAARQAIAAGAPTEPVQHLVARWENQGYPSAPGLVVIKTIAQVAGDGLPTEPLIQKAIEGLAKNVTPERIRQVVEHRAQTLRTARSLLDDRPGSAGSAQERSRAIQALSDALAQGASPGDLETVIRRVEMVKGANPVQWTEAAADAVAGLMTSGLDSKAATNATIAKLSDAKSPRDLRQLAGHALALQRTGLSPSQIVERLHHGFEGGGKLGPSGELSPGRQTPTPAPSRPVPRPPARR